jgi:pimeloyl-ACP methyl ester carboxylesterase/predicted glycosyltransferase
VSVADRPDAAPAGHGDPAGAALGEHPAGAARRDQSRARYPDVEGYLDRDGVRIGYEIYGSGEPTILLMPSWEIVHSRSWKFQIPYLARHSRVIAFDPRGNGRSDRPASVTSYDRRHQTEDALAVLDAAGADRAVVLAWCSGGAELLLAAEHPDRVTGIVMIAPDLRLTPDPADEEGWQSFDAELDGYQRWQKWNRHYWLRDWPGFLDFFFRECFTEPHSTKQIEDAIGWGLETDPQTVVRGLDAEWFNDAESARELCGRVQCPVLVIQGTADAVAGPARGPAVAAALGRAELVLMEGSGHGPHLRDPVRTNLIIRDFACPPPPPRRWRRGRSRPQRALYLSSPIGLGHARRDIAIATELRKLRPGLEIDWLAQDPVTRVLAASGERIHPASAELASESGHIESESAEHDLHCFQAWRRMDEILVANFMAFHDLIRDEQYDLWIGDEAWELDYYLHENPDLKTAAYAWLTDFVGWLPMPDGGPAEAALTADYNAEMIEHIARFPRVRDRAIFVGDPDDIVPDAFGPDLPSIRGWTEQNYDFAGYVTGFDPAQLADRERLGYRPDERVCVVTVGGSGVGGHLLRRVIAAFPAARELVPDLRMIVVAGPRIDPASLPAHDGLEIRPYVHELYRHLAACDLAIVQGGLTTAMELTASRRPFLYFPLRHHFEQNFHVRHRLERYGAGRRMDFETAQPADIAAAIGAEIGRAVHYRPVPADGAARAAGMIADLL